MKTTTNDFLKSVRLYFASYSVTASHVKEKVRCNFTLDYQINAALDPTLSSNSCLKYLEGIVVYK